MRYVALGSSMAAGPGIPPRVAGAPFLAGRSERNYAHVAAQQLGADLVDVTFSGATTAHILRDPQRGYPPQSDALDGSEDLVTVTIGGNDVGYVPLLFAGSLPAWARRLPVIGTGARDLLDPVARESALERVSAELTAVGSLIRGKAPRARILFVDYLTLLPPPGVAASPLSTEVADLGRHVAARLAELTAAAARETGCELVTAAEASRDHHAWSDAPWTLGAGWPLPGRPQPFHPNAAGMRAVADLIVAKVGQ